MTTELERTLSQMQAQIHRERISLGPDDRKFLGYADCVRSQLVLPMLEALGWNSADADEVRLDFRLDEQNGTSDLIALFLSGIPSFLVELRGLGDEFLPDTVLNRLLPRAGDAGFEWLLLTDGDSYDVYNAHSGLPTEQRAFDSVRLSVDSPEDALELFGLLSKQRLKENRIESQWRCRIVDRQVEESLVGLLTPESPLVQLLLRATHNLSATDVRCSLSRATATLAFEYGGNNKSFTEVEAEHTLDCATGMSEAELRIATWLQRRSIERWAKGASDVTRSRNSQRRVLDQRRSCEDRRSGEHDRRVARVARAEDRRAGKQRRSRERRETTDRRATGDRRRGRRRA